MRPPETLAAAPAPDIDLRDEAATLAFGEDLAMALRRGDVLALSGDLGAGKTTLARAIIRAVAGEPGLEVPSPTFTLVQTYDTGRLSIAHFDLYRLSSPDELDELGLEEAAGEGAVLVEWPGRAGDRLPAERADIGLGIAGAGRRATVGGAPDLVGRIARSRAARAFLDGAGFAGARRRHLQGDASTRRYERVRCGDREAVLMDWPVRPEAAAAADPRIAFRAKDVGAFVAVDEALRGAGLSAPAVLAADIGAGFLLLEDLGKEGVLLPSGAPDPDRYGLVIDLLAAIHDAPRPEMLSRPGGHRHRLLSLGPEALAAEIALFNEWYVPLATGGSLPPDARADFDVLWAGLFARLATAEKSWVLFDVQAPNLLWLAGREGLAKVGLLDFQDMFFGPAAYDVASLCQDPRVTVPAALETALRDRYVARRRNSAARFDEALFLEAYAILAAERVLKNLGVFARLAVHAGKREYLAHVPRLCEYLSRALAHPVLRGYAQWHARHMPPLP